jgi:hypothetical protein
MEANSDYLKGKADVRRKRKKEQKDLSNDPRRNREGDQQIQRNYEWRKQHVHPPFKRSQSRAY